MAYQLGGEDAYEMIGEAARVRMVVLPPESALPSRSAEENSARTAIRDFITARGAGAPRIAETRWRS